jgi:hypothetical protein
VHAAVYFKSRVGLVLYTVVLIVASCLLAWVCAACVGDSIANFVSEQSSDDFNNLAAQLVLQTTKADFLLEVRMVSNCVAIVLAFTRGDPRFTVPPSISLVLCSRAIFCARRHWLVDC